MDKAPDQGSVGSQTVEFSIEQYLRSIESGNYRRTAQSVLSKWSEWLVEEHNIESLTGISVLLCRKYARHLKTRSRDGEMKASTANTYYSVLRAFLGFCVDEEVIDSNPAAVKRAVDELPSESGDVDRQFWGEAERKAFLKHLDERARNYIDGGSIDRVDAYRDRALVYVLAFSGVRGGEVFSDPADKKRNGARWNDLDLENGTLKVFGKSREYEYAQVPEEAINVLMRYQKVLDPAAEDWPLFPSNHAPSKYSAIRNALDNEGLIESEIEQLLQDNSPDEVIREYKITPPALSKNGARNVVQRLCNEADVEIDGEPLKLHGARRGLGHELYQKGHAELAQSALRHSSIDVTHESYSDIQASETADKVGDVLNSE
jgi:integrase